MPLLLTLLFFVYLALCGRAAFAVLGVRLGHVRTWLLAPTLGLAVTCLAVMILNQGGLPVNTFARPLTLGLLVAAVGVVLLYRARPPRGLSPFALLAVGALILGGWPACVHGFQWVGYGNDDMTNYCLGAYRFLTHGFYDQPTSTDLAGGDYSQITWLMYVAGLIRFGSEHLIAVAAGTVGRPTQQVFMAVILTLSLAQLWAVTALALTAPRRRTLALGAGAILMVAPLWYYGTMYQLIAQVGGLGLLVATLALTARPRFPRSLPGQLRYGALCALSIGGLSIFYPEVIPFYLFGWFGFMVLRLRRLGYELPRLVATVGFAALGLVLLLRHNVLSTAFTLLGQAQDGLNAMGVAARIALFPYFLMPPGPAFFLGFDVIVARFPDPYSTPALLAGFVALGLALLLEWRGLRERAVSATVLVGMVLMAAQLFRATNGFGLFKLAMFALPFVAVELARSLELRRGRMLIRGVLLLILPVWLLGSIRYTEASLATSASLVDELFDASASRGHLPAVGAAPVWSDIASSPVAKLLMLEGVALHPIFVSQPFFAEYLGIANKPWPDWVYRCMPGPPVDRTTAATVVRRIEHNVFRPSSAARLKFQQRSAPGPVPPPGLGHLVTSQGEIRSFNKLSGHRPGTGLFATLPLDQLENHLAFIRSHEGEHYYLGHGGYISVYKPEPDLYTPDGYFFAIGRHLLFQVINPTEKVRLRLSLTASILGEGRTELPPSARVYGAEPGGVGLGLLGAGSANIFSPPVRPFLLNGAAYVALDLGRSTLPIGRPGSGLQALYNRDLSFDTRFALGYCRDISVLSEATYSKLPRRRQLDRFPADLTGPDAAEYSGIYEDGWISAQAFALLGPVAGGERIRVEAMLPLVPGTRPGLRRVELRIDSRLVVTRDLPPGDFVLEAPIVHDGNLVRVELRFDHADTLPAPDSRPVAALLKSIQIVPAP